MGGGGQPFPWVHVKDLAGMIKLAVEEEKMEGVYNAVAPQVTKRKGRLSEEIKLNENPFKDRMGYQIDTYLVISVSSIHYLKSSLRSFDAAIAKFLME